MGKVKKGKVYRKRKGARKAIKVSIPYGKGKENSKQLSSTDSFVSIPYGKGKDKIETKSRCGTMYQSPMGKVK